MNLFKTAYRFENFVGNKENKTPSPLNIIHILKKILVCKNEGNEKEIQ